MYLISFLMCTLHKILFQHLRSGGISIWVRLLCMLPASSRWRYLTWHFHSVYRWLAKNSMCNLPILLFCTRNRCSDRFYFAFAQSLSHALWLWISHNVAIHRNSFLFSFMVFLFLNSSFHVHLQLYTVSDNVCTLDFPVMPFDSRSCYGFFYHCLLV